MHDAPDRGSFRRKDALPLGWPVGVQPFLPVSRARIVRQGFRAMTPNQTSSSWGWQRPPDGCGGTAHVRPTTLVGAHRAVSVGPETGRSRSIHGACAAGPKCAIFDCQKCAVFGCH